MSRNPFATFLALAALALSLALPAAALAAARPETDKTEIFDVRFGVDANQRTRIVLDISGDPFYRAWLSEEDDGARRLNVEIDSARFDVGGQLGGSGNGIGQLGEYRYSASTDGLASLTFNLDTPAVPQAVFVIKPKGDTPHYRLVIDMTPSSVAAFEAQLSREHGPMQGGRPEQTAPSPEEQPAAEALAQISGEDAAPTVDDTRDTETEILARNAAGRATMLAAMDDVPEPRLKPRTISRTASSRASRKIIIDPGHGGRDPGAVGAGGNLEKDVVLAAAKSLKEVLEARGYEIVLTRSSDVKVDLEDRMPRRSREPADLFLSIHADSIERSEVRGASVYTLSQKGELRLANQINRMKAEGDAMIGNVDIAAEDADIGAIIADLSSNRAQESSALLAQHLIRNLEGRIAMVNNTHRQENLVVLLAPDMPAVLLELGFMSNIHDEANLVRDSWRDRAMEAVADGIDDYFAEQFPARHVSLIEGAR